MLSSKFQLLRAWDVQPAAVECSQLQGVSINGFVAARASTGTKDISLATSVT